MQTANVNESKILHITSSNLIAYLISANILGFLSGVVFWAAGSSF